MSPDPVPIDERLAQPNHGVFLGNSVRLRDGSIKAENLPSEIVKIRHPIQFIHGRRVCMKCTSLHLQPSMHLGEAAQGIETPNDSRAKVHT